jgi:hypothetical protein
MGAKNLMRIPHIALLFPGLHFYPTMPHTEWCPTGAGGPCAGTRAIALGEEGRHKGINGGDFRIQHGPAGAFKQKGTVLLCMSIILVFLAGFLAGLELKRVPEQENPCFRSLFPGRATSCRTKRYTEPYVSAHMRPLVLSLRPPRRVA